MCTTINGLEFYNACCCAGTGCGGHLVLNPAFANITPIGYQGAAQHAYTMACAGFRAPGPCPQPEHRHYFVMITGGMACACGERIP